MKKRLLFAFMALCVAVSGFALTEGEYVYTPQGRFQIKSAPVASSIFTDFSGWEVITATEGKTIQDIFAIDAEQGPAPGVNCAYSLDATEGEGMYFKFTPTSAGNSYVVSFKMKGAQTVTTRVKTVAVSSNLVKVEGNSDGFYNGTTDVLVCNTAEETSDNWETYNYAIVGDGTSRTYFISFSGMASNIYIADLQIAEALQVADLRARDAAIERINVYKNVYAWPEDVIADYGINDALEALNAIGDQSAQAELDGALETAEATLAEFLNQNMDDYLAGGDIRNYLSNTIDSKGGSKVSKYGVWNCLPGGRGHWDANAYPDMGHFQNSNTWNNGAPTTAMGMTTQMELSPGAYVFAIKGAAALREPKKNDWNNDDGMCPAYGIAYIAKVVDGAVGDTLGLVQKDLEPVKMTPFYLTLNVTETATFELGLLAYCKEAYQGLKLGSVTYVGDASILGKNENKYNQKQLKYEADVREQITTGRDELTKAAESIANPEKYWGKAELQACVDTVAPKIAKYEAMSQDEIIATYQDYYTKTTSDDNGLMVYEVYQAGVKDIIAANRRFTALNDTLESMQATIEGAENTMAMRVYDAATGKDALTAAINKAKGIQAQMQATQYSEENAAAVVAANTELNDAVEIFKASVPASAVTTVVDIDFEQAAVQNQETLSYSVTGAAGTMEFSNFVEGDPTDAYPYQQGIWSNGEQLYKGYVRVGKGTGTVNFTPAVGGDMGNNILRVKCDFYLQGLSGKFIGFYLKGAQEDASAAAPIISGFYANYYDNKIDATSTLPIDLGNLKYGSGSGYANRPPQDAEGAEGTVLAKNSFEVILDYGEGSVYCTTTSDKGTFTTEKKVFDKSVPVQFVLQSDYINNDRRCWFDNLKIETIQAGPTKPFVPTGIENAKAADAKEAPVKVLENGQIIIGGKYNAAGALVK